MRIVPRVFPNNLQVEIEPSKLKTLPILDLNGKICGYNEMYRTFNMGVGMVLIIDEVDVALYVII